MERYLLHSRHKQSVAEKSKMAPGSSLVASDTAVTAGASPPASPSSPPQDKLGVDAASDPEWDVTATPTPSQPYIDYRRLAIEVATRIAPDLQETLENTVQVSLLKLQADIHAHTGRLTELENRVFTLKDDNDKLSNTVSTLSADLSRMGEKIEDVENRSRRNNFRIGGPPRICSTKRPPTLMRN